MYAAELAPESGGEVDRLVGDYFDAAEKVLMDVFGYTDSGIDVDELLSELEVAYRRISVRLRGDLDLADHYLFVRSVGMESLVEDGGGS